MPAIRSIDGIPFKDVRVTEHFWRDLAQAVEGGKIGTHETGPEFSREKIILPSMRSPIVFKYRVGADGKSKKLSVETRINGVDRNIDGRVEFGFNPSEMEALLYWPGRFVIERRAGGFYASLNKEGLLDGDHDMELACGGDVSDVPRIRIPFEAHRRAALEALRQMGLGGIEIVEKS